MKVALLQMTGGTDLAANAQTLVDAVRDAAAGGAQMLFTPEMSGLLDRDRVRAAASIRAEQDDPVLAAVRRAAAEAGLWVHLGSLAVRGGDGRLANRGFVIDATGAIRARYDKLHLFDVTLPTGESWRESASYAPGEAACVVDTPAGAGGPVDLLRPALCRALCGVERRRRHGAGDPGGVHGARPAARTGTSCCAPGRSRRVPMWWPPRIPACIRTAARPMAIRWSSIRGARCCSTWASGPGIGFADLDPARVDEVRGRIPVLAHRRPIPPVAVGS